MSLKKVYAKIIASVLAIYMVMGNITIAGIGLTKVFAEENKVPAITMEMQIQKYIPYSNEIETGVILQTKLLIGEEASKDEHRQISETQINIQTPEINGLKPERVNVIDANTVLTNGKENEEISQNYDKESGLLNIFYENKDNYNEYKENEKDEFEIIYIYSQEAYNKEQEKISTKLNVNVERKYKVEEEILTTKKEESYTISQEGVLGDIVSVDVQNSEIYKGYMISNVKNGTNYQTEYFQKSNYNVSNSNNIDSLEILLDSSRYTLIEGDKENEIEANGTITYKSTKVSENEFNKIFGTDGYIDFYLRDLKFATVKYIEIEGNRQYVTEYTNGKIESEEAGIVVYPENTDIVTLKTSKPQTEGNIEIENKKVIQAKNDYGIKVENISSLKERLEVKAINNKTEEIEDELGNKQTITKDIILSASKSIKNIETKAPTTQMSLDLTNSNLSTLTTNRTTMIIRLNDTNSSCKLFEEGILEITLPSNLSSAKITSAKSLYENGLKITSAKIQNDKIILTVEGKQTAYDIENISGGVNIVIDLELDIQDTVPTHEETLELIYGKEKVSTNVNIVSKSGLFMLSEISGYDDANSIITTIDSNVKDIEISHKAKERQVSQVLTLINNHDQDITQMQLIGRIGFSDKDKNSTFDTELAQPIQINKTDAKIYYSTNKDAVYDDNSWTEEYSKDARAYKIVLNNNKLSKAEKLEIKIVVNLPENIGYNQATYIKDQANYLYNNQRIENSSTVCMQTAKEELSKNISKVQQEVVTEQGQTAKLTLSITPRITETNVHSEQLVSYVVRVENNSRVDLNNITIEDIIPDNAVYTYEEEKQGNITNYIEIVKDAQTKIKNWDIDILKAGEVKEYEILLTMANVEQEQEVLNGVNLKYNGQTISVESKLKLKPALLITSLTTKEEGMVDVTYNKGSIVEYYVKVKNNTNKNVNNAELEYVIPEYLEYIEGGIGKFDNFKGYSIEKQGIIDNNIFKYNIDNLKANEEKVIVIKCEIKRLERTYEANINSLANVYLQDDIYQTNIKTIKTVQARFNMSLSVDTNKKEILEKNDALTYIIKVKNIGKRTAMFNIEDSIPKEIEINKIQYDIDGKNSITIETSTQDIKISNSLQEGQTLTLKITGKIRNIEVNEETELIINNKASLLQDGEMIAEEAISFKMKPEFKEEDKTQDQPETPGNSGTEDKENNGEENQEKETYELSGIAWLDTNKNGQRENGEELLENIKVTLIDADKGEIAKDSEGKEITVLTDSKGVYKFSNLQNGKYLVMFEFDTNKYTVTTYKKSGIYADTNSDAIISKVKINGEEKLVGITDNIQVEKNINNIDLGIIENATFDLSLDKLISKVTVTNDQGTKTTEYKEENFVKTDLVAKYMNNTNVIITYKFVVKNEGDVTGYVDKLVDNLPSGLEFSSELNKAWYKGSDGNLYTSLSEVGIKPGETAVIELVLTKKTTENTTGTFSNNAQIVEMSNIEAIKEKTDAIQNNKSSADLVLSIKTGSAFMYIGITITCIAIIGAGAYIIKKKVLNKGI